MSIFERLTTRNLENPAIPITSPKLIELLGGTATDAGKKVTVDNSVAMSAVYRCVAILSGTGGSLPFKCYDKESYTEVITPLIDDPHPDMSSTEFWSLVIAHMATWGNHYSLIQRDTFTGGRKYLWPILPDRVKVHRVEPTDANPQGKEFEILRGTRDSNGRLIEATFGTDDPRTRLTSEDVFHVPGMSLNGITGISPIAAARQAISAGLAAESYANRFWSTGALAGGLLSTDQRLEEEKAQALKKRWRDKMTGIENAHEAVILDQGMNFQPLSIPPQDAQFIETRRFQITEIARFYGIPPYLLAETDRSTSWGTGIEIQGTGFVTYTLAPGYLSRIEGRATKYLCMPEHFSEFQVQGLMRGDASSRASFYQTLFQIGALTVDEIRELENLPSIPGLEGGTDASRLPSSDSDPFNAESGETQ